LSETIITQTAFRLPRNVGSGRMHLPCLSKVEYLEGPRDPTFFHVVCALFAAFACASGRPVKVQATWWSLISCCSVPEFDLSTSSIRWSSIILWKVATVILHTRENCNLHARLNNKGTLLSETFITQTAFRLSRNIGWGRMHLPCFSQVEYLEGPRDPTFFPCRLCFVCGVCLFIWQTTQSASYRVELDFLLSGTRIGSENILYQVIIHHPLESCNCHPSTTVMALLPQGFHHRKARTVLQISVLTTVVRLPCAKVRCFADLLMCLVPPNAHL